MSYLQYGVLFFMCGYIDCQNGVGLLKEIRLRRVYVSILETPPDN
jgi:hypothetical protein